MQLDTHDELTDSREEAWLAMRCRQKKDAPTAILAIYGREEQRPYDRDSRFIVLPHGGAQHTKTKRVHRKVYKTTGFMMVGDYEDNVHSMSLRHYRKWFARRSEEAESLTLDQAVALIDRHNFLPPHSWRRVGDLVVTGDGTCYGADGEVVNDLLTCTSAYHAAFNRALRAVYAADHPFFHNLASRYAVKSTAGILDRISVSDVSSHGDIYAGASGGFDVAQDYVFGTKVRVTDGTGRAIAKHLLLNRTPDGYDRKQSLHFLERDGDMPWHVEPDDTGNCTFYVENPSPSMIGDRFIVCVPTGYLPDDFEQNVQSITMNVSASGVLHVSIHDWRSND